VLASETTTLEELMAAPPVTVDSGLVKEDVVDVFAKYQFRLLPVVDARDRLLGVVGYKDIMR
jgi:Mg/Co/Ni transporter MgtE